MVNVGGNNNITLLKYYTHSYYVLLSGNVSFFILIIEANIYYDTFDNIMSMSILTSTENNGLLITTILTMFHEAKKVVFPQFSV